MSTALTSIFGTAIKAFAQPVNSDRQYAGLPGANGILSMNLGTRGRQLVVTGRLYTTGANYSTARAAMVSAIASIEAYLFPGVAAIDITYYGETYYNCVMDRFQLIPDKEGKLYHWLATGMAVDFICYWREQGA